MYCMRQIEDAMQGVQVFYFPITETNEWRLSVEDTPYSTAPGIVVTVSPSYSIDFMEKYK